MYAGSRLGGVWRSADGGATWTSAGLADREVFAVAVGPAGEVFAGCEPSALFRSDDGGAEWVELGALRGVPSASSWSYPPRPWTSHVRWIAPDPTTRTVVLVGIEAGAVLLTEDGGWTWEDHRPGADRDPHALAWHPAVPRRAYQAGGGGAAWSRDGGRTWRRADAGRDRHYTWGLALDPGGSRPLVGVGGERAVARARRARHPRAHLPLGRGRLARGDRGPRRLPLRPAASRAGSCTPAWATGGCCAAPTEARPGRTWTIDGDAPSRVTALAAG